MGIATVSSTNARDFHDRHDRHGRDWKSPVGRKSRLHLFPRRKALPRIQCRKLEEFDTRPLSPVYESRAPFRSFRSADTISRLHRSAIRCAK